MSEEELALLARIAPRLNELLKGALVVYVFTASFMGDSLWVCRADYVLEGEDPTKKMKSLLIEGQRDSICNFHNLRPRIFRERPSIAILRQGLIDLTLENPDPGERQV